MTLSDRALLWFRADLRTDDNHALCHACEHSRRGVIAVFTICPKQWKQHDWADIKVAFLLRNLKELSSRLEKLNIPLLILQQEKFDAIPEVLLNLARQHRCDGLFYNREYEVNELARDEAVEKLFRREGLAVHTFQDQTILPPGAIQTAQRSFYTVFTPYRNRWVQEMVKRGGPAIAPPPKPQTTMPCRPDKIPNFIDGFDPEKDRPDLWPAGEQPAHERLNGFTAEAIRHYKSKRDFPAVEGTSRLSPYLTLGIISPRRCLEAAMEENKGSVGKNLAGPSTWINELIWREFYRHILVGYPRVCKNRPFREQYNDSALNWSQNQDHFSAWCEGRTGVPIVDAAMRCLNQTGWMHNRLRMIVAMYLTKDLWLNWRWGESYFMRRLVDGDFASNNGGWQWSASTGTDAAPYFRIYNPYTQSQRFDPGGEFIREWVPELCEVKGKAIHNPAESAPADLLKQANYPAPIVDHKEARIHAIEAFKALKK